MTHRRPIPVLTVAAFLLALLPGSRAAAIGFKSLQLRQIDNDEIIGSSETPVAKLKEYFNRARCECGANNPAAPDMRLKVEYDSNPQLQPDSAYIQVVAGRNCFDTVNQIIQENCTVLYARRKINERAGDLDIPIGSHVLMGGDCSEKEDTYTVYVYTDENNDDKWEERKKIDFSVDTRRPDAPISGTVSGGESMVKVSFSAPGTSDSTTDGGTSSSTPKNVKGYQILCAEIDASGNETPAFSSPPEAAYDSATSLCEGTASPAVDAGPGVEAGSGAGAPLPFGEEDLGVSDASGDLPLTEGGPVEPVDAGPPDSGAPPADASQVTSASLTSLDPAFVCYELTDTPGTVNITKLQNNKKYRFYAITIDTFRNPSTPTKLGEDETKLIEDLWERYKRSGGKSEGGYCFVATAAYGDYDHPQVRILRQFRDQVLQRSPLGRLLVLSYYLASPGPAGWIAEHDGARSLARASLWPVTLAAAAHLYTTTSQKLLLLGTGLLLLGWAQFRRRARRRAAGGRP